MRIITAALFISAIVLCGADDNESITQAGQTIQKLLNERIGKKIVEAAKEVKGILSKSLGSHVKKATAKLILDNAVDKLENQVTQNDGVATVGTDQAGDDCINDCKMKKLAKQGKTAKPKIHHVKSMHKGAPGHHNKGPRHRKNMEGPGVPQMPNQAMQQQPMPPNPNVPPMPQQPPQPTCPPPCPTACAPACTQDCCRPMLSLMQLPAPPPPYYPPPPPMPICAPPCTQPSCAPACPPACCSTPPPPPPPPPPACPPICVQHCYTICPRGCCRSEIAHKKEKIVHDMTTEEDDEGSDEEEETGAIISNRKSGSLESNPMQRNKIPKRKTPTYNTLH